MTYLQTLYLYTFIVKKLICLSFDSMLFLRLLYVENMFSNQIISRYSIGVTLKKLVLVKWILEEIPQLLYCYEPLNVHWPGQSKKLWEILYFMCFPYETY